jgi:pilus assembly protein Flp/PilA
MMFRSERKIWAEDGQGLVEYALIILLIAVAIVAALGGFGAGLSSLFSTITGSF